MLTEPHPCLARADSVQSCHNQVFADIESKKGEIEASNNRRGGGRGGVFTNSRASSRGEADIEALIVKLTMVLDYERCLITLHSYLHLQGPSVRPFHRETHV